MQVDYVQNFDASRQVKHFSFHLKEKNTLGSDFVTDGLLRPYFHSQTFAGFLS